MTSGRSRDGRAIEQLASFTPSDDDGDVYSACTAVAVLPDSFMDDLRGGKTAEEVPTSRYKVLAEADLVEQALPTEPPPPVSSERRMRELNATVKAALAAAAPPLDVAPFLLSTQPAAPAPSTPVAPSPMIAPFPMVAASPRAPTARPADLEVVFHPGTTEAEKNDERWVTIVLAAAIVVAFLASVGSVVLALTAD